MTSFLLHKHFNLTLNIFHFQSQVLLNPPNRLSSSKSSTHFICELTIEKTYFLNLKKLAQR